jgi:hypothetical protein
VTREIINQTAPSITKKEKFLSAFFKHLGVWWGLEAKLHGFIITAVDGPQGSYSHFGGQKIV